jgi:hypothetical protein
VDVLNVRETRLRDMGARDLGRRPASRQEQRPSPRKTVLEPGLPVYPRWQHPTKKENTMSTCETQVAAEAVVAEDQLATLIAEQLNLGMSVMFFPVGGKIELVLEPYNRDDDSGRWSFGETALDALRNALDIDREMRGLFA